MMQRTPSERAIERAACPSEDAEQEAVVKWLVANGLDFFAVPNGGRRGAREAAKLKRTGVIPGVADLMIFLPGPWIIALEMKVREGGRSSPAQIAWHAKHGQLHGWTCLVCHGAAEAISELSRVTSRTLSGMIGRRL